MGYWNEQEVIKIRSTARAEEVVEVEEDKEEQEEDKNSGRRHPKLVRQSRVKESMSPRTIRCHLYLSSYQNEAEHTKQSVLEQYYRLLLVKMGCRVPCPSAFAFKSNVNEVVITKKIQRTYNIPSF